jgi:DNA (cytosine-5)-methyltransferase 1
VIQRPSRLPIPVVDLFAGPGGLSEGFASLVTGSQSECAFDVGVSIEKDPVAARTLELRALFRSFGKHVPDAYFDYMRGDLTRAQLFENPKFRDHAEHARVEAICAELGSTPPGIIDGSISRFLKGSDDWVLIGGPPCQAYSIVGRSRLRGCNPEKFENDPRHLLYREYLRVIKTHKPAVFVMENVKGILTSQHKGSGIFERILQDLSEPARGLSYQIRSLVSPEDAAPQRGAYDFLIRSELFGVPQARHRVILLGVRTDLCSVESDCLKRVVSPATVQDVLSDLPFIRSHLSQEPDSASAWLGALSEATRLLRGWQHPRRSKVIEEMRAAADGAGYITSRGSRFMNRARSMASGTQLSRWLDDPRVGGVCQHEARPHMRSDLHRYLWASSFARVVGASPKLPIFPPSLLPAHANASGDEVPFKDRFRVQVWDQPSTTVVSHIAKDGHYFIHPDPSQCRSLTVREAARLQTFPDNYFFEGGRTQQFAQIGNAVPPFLARQIAAIVARLLGGNASASAVGGPDWLDPPAQGSPSQ